MIVSYVITDILIKIPEYSRRFNFSLCL